MHGFGDWLATGTKIEGQSRMFGDFGDIIYQKGKEHMGR